MTLQVTLNLILKALQQQTDEMGTPTDNPRFPTIDIAQPLTLSSGTAAGQANALHHNRYSINGTNATTLDLIGGLADEFGVTANFDKMKVYAFCNRSTNAADIIVVGGAAANAWNGWTSIAGSTFLVFPGTGSFPGFQIAAAPALAGMAVTAGTGDQLKIVNQATNVVALDVFLAGVDA